MIGSPGGNHGVTTKARIIEEAATIRKKALVSRGYCRPKNAAGAASSSHDAGLPMALAPRAPYKREDVPKDEHAYAGKLEACAHCGWAARRLRQGYCGGLIYRDLCGCQAS